MSRERILLHQAGVGKKIFHGGEWPEKKFVWVQFLIFRGALLLSWGRNLIKGGNATFPINEGLLSVRGAIASHEKRELCHEGIGGGKVQL